MITGIRTHACLCIMHVHLGMQASVHRHTIICKHALAHKKMFVCRVGQDHICTPYMTVYLVIASKNTCSHRIYIYPYIYMVLANPMYVYMCCIMESVNRTCYVSFMFLTCPAIFAFEWQIKRSRRGKTDFLT